MVERVKLKPGVFKKDDTRINRKGRPAGSHNKITTLLKDAIVMAANLVGADRRGKDGLVGYLVWLAKNEPRSFATLLGRTIPLHVVGDMDHTHRVYTDKEDIKQQLRERGIPVDAVYPHRIPRPKDVPAPRTLN